jgi:hypothetical protein
MYANWNANGCGCGRARNLNGQRADPSRFCRGSRLRSLGVGCRSCLERDSERHSYSAAWRALPRRPAVPNPKAQPSRPNAPKPTSSACCPPAYSASVTPLSALRISRRPAWSAARSTDAFYASQRSYTFSFSPATARICSDLGTDAADHRCGSVRPWGLRTSAFRRSRAATN